LNLLIEQPARPARPDLDEFWRAAHQELKEARLGEDYQVRWIGLNDETTKQILELIQIGDKTGTFTLPWIVAKTDRVMPEAGDAIVLVDFDGAPKLLVRLTAIEEVLFGEITTGHIAIDGTPVRALDVWKPLHTQYWNQMLEPFDLTVSDDMPVLVEKFELLYPNSQLRP